MKICFIIFERAVEGLMYDSQCIDDEASSVDFEDAILAGIDKMPWKRIAELMVDHVEVAEQFLLLMTTMFSVEKFRNKNGAFIVKKHLMKSLKIEEIY